MDSNKLDRYITGNYGEDQFKDQVEDMIDIAYCKFLDELEASGNNTVSDPRDTFIAGWDAALEAAKGTSVIDFINDLETLKSTYDPRP